MPKATWSDKTIAESDETVIVDGNHYFPMDSLTMECFEKSEHTSVCGWKGTASYYHVVVGDSRNENAAWYYPAPKEAAENIRGRVAFWSGVVVSD